ncbi:YdeI/OmpD-associated family protein [Terriglobus roseus]|uniref:Bacteriocin-protection, YdeI or OmpD-Associated n=1 Tax=Terriglobus roseus TaxID=392734 RepID=A0A1H4PZJ1_9BACT|nr:YdeI/OmpD-associated family protein [Terriglobus roseus]SEC12720.1 Bacteriocin-protection, YdeI or OmpD-Associated [Terriglobus roseus]
MKKNFQAAIEKGTGGLGWTIAQIPFDPLVDWTDRIRLRVKGTINGFSFRTSLFPLAGEAGKYFLLVNREMQTGGRVGPGHVAQFVLEADLDPRPAEVPEELDALLDEENGLRAWYDSLSEYTRREIGKWICDVKSDEARMRRAQTMTERLFGTMEAEAELPPAIRKALDARPKANSGWQTMTPTQRRMELFAVSAYQSPESRAKRIDKLCDAAVKHAGKK